MATVQLTASYPWDLAMNCLTLATNVITTGLVICRGRWVDPLLVPRCEIHKFAQTILHPKQSCIGIGRQ